jgi:prepilin-type N-terminal cleavage/methylation domain-containing protein
MRTIFKSATCQRGFTLLEVLLTIALMSILFAFSTPIYQSLQARNSLDVATDTSVQMLRRAQILSQAVDGDASWGVRIQNDEITLFRGNDFASRTTDFDEFFKLSAAITFSGLSEIVFAKFSGEPSTTGILTFTSSTNEVRVAEINSKGVIHY